jgi:UDP-N-acetylglucosamine 2-epimerase
MYESRFGITGPPFQLSPDPSFYFDSRGHHRALAELRAGLESDTGFIVVSGEVGAGKTTLVRTLLAEIDPTNLAIAHVVSTQLDADELLAAACIGFGLPVGSTPRDELASKLLRFLLKLDKEGRRAVLIIDEAQNLRRDAFDRLLMATGKSARRMPLQVILLGQPELRQLIETPEFAKLRAEISVSWHLGPIEPGETGPYVEHRLRKVGWKGVPAFDAGAFEEIFRWSGGIPRRINLLCNRLMLACFLAGHERIDAALVAATARDLRAELGETTDEPTVVDAPADSGTTAPQATHRAPRLQDPLFEPMEPGPLLCVVTGHRDHIKASALMRSFAGRRDLPAAKLVRVHNNDALAMHGALFAGLHVERALINLSIAEADPAAASTELKKVFEFVVDHVLPNAVIVFDGSEAALACATVARAKGVPVVHVGAGLRLPGDTPEGEARKATDAMADLLYTTDAQASETLVDEGVPPERVHCVGNLLMDAMQAGLRTAAGSVLGLDGSPGAQPFLIDRNGYALVVLARSLSHADRQTLGEVLAILRDVSRDIPLVWPVGPKAEAQLRKVRLEGIFSGDRITRLPQQAYPEYLDVLRHATCVLTDSWSTQEEATALGVPCLTFGAHPERPVTTTAGSNTYIGSNRALARRVVWECIFNGGKRGRVPDMWDGKTAARIAGYLAAWLPAVEHASHE